jgi:hypothetical protein
MPKNTTDKTIVQRLNLKIDIPHYSTVNFLRLGDRHAEVTYMKFAPKATIKKISKTEYEVLSTGEIKHFDQTLEGKQITIIKKSMRRLEQLIKTNFDAVGNALNALFVTLTYEGANMTDTDRLYDDFDKFMKRLKYAMKGHKLDYIVVAEPHESGGWHMHMLLKSDQPKLWIDNNEQMQPLWGQGFTKTVRLKSDDVGCYYTAYFSNVEAPISFTEADPDPEAEYAFTKDDETGKQKRFKKGDRLRFYPKHFKFYRASRGIERPLPEQKKYSEVPKDLGKPVRADTYEISKTYTKYDQETVMLKAENKVLNVVQREVFKKFQSPPGEV